MEYKSLELKVGFTIFLAIVVFTVGLMWFEGFHLVTKTIEIRVVFPMVGGIDPGEAVSVNGVEMGKVKEITLRENDVMITMSIDAAARIPVDSRVVLQTKGIMGERMIAIIMGTSPEAVKTGDVLQGVYDPGVSEVLASMGKLMDDLEKLAADIGRLTEILTGGDRLEKTISNLASITEELKTMIEGQSGTLSKGVNSFSRSTGRLDSLLARNTSRIDSLIARLDEVSGSMPDLFDNIRDVTSTLGEIARRLESDDNTMGALLNDREFLDRLEKAVTGLDELVRDIKANPKKYLKVEIF